MGMKLNIVCVLAGLVFAANGFAAEVCTVSMMGRVCYEEGSPELTAAHMKGDAVAESSQSKAKREAPEATRVADAKKK